MGDQYLLNRRRFIGSAAFTSIGFSGFLSGCGLTGSSGTTTSGEAAGHVKAPVRELSFSNWPLYIDRSVLRDFERIFGAKVTYREEIDGNWNYFLKFAGDLREGRPIGRDLVVLTSWMAARWIREGYVEEIDKRNVPNAANLRRQLQSPSFDPERKYTLPWQAGIISIAYNPKKTGRKLRSINDLFDPAFKNRVTLFADGFSSAALVLLGAGTSPEHATLDDLLGAIEKIDREARKGQIHSFVGNEYTTALVKGDIWVSLAYSGDLLQLKSVNPDLEFFIPEEGAILSSDEMLIPKGAEHPYAAEVMMNYVYDPKVAARITRYVRYVTPVAGAYEEIKRVDPELAQEVLIFPSNDVLDSLHTIPRLIPEEEEAFTAAMDHVVKTIHRDQGM